MPYKKKENENGYDIVQIIYPDDQCMEYIIMHF